MGQIIRIGGAAAPDLPQTPLPNGERRALVLGGGGIAGAAFHIGALLALDEAFSGFDATAFDVFVGTSAGAFVAAHLANGISPEQLARSQLGFREDLPAIRRREILKPVRGRLPRGVMASAGALRSTLRQVGRSRLETSFVDTFFSMTEGLASWRLYTTKGIEEYLRRIFSGAGRTDEFCDTQKELLVVATDLDTAERTVFGEPDCQEAAISQAVAASAAIPVIYAPVRIGGREYLDGGLRSATNLDVALSRGATLVVLINPLVPYLHDPRYLLRGFDSPILHVSDGGLGRLIAQVFRIMAQAQLDKELDLMKAKYPSADILVIEPHRDDEHLFLFNLMDYSARVQLARDAFEQVAVDLVTHFPTVKKLFANRGIDVEKEGLLAEVRRVLGGGIASVLEERVEEESA